LENVLEKIVAHKRNEIDAAKDRCPAEQLETLLHGAPPVRDFTAALASAEGMALIAEVKKASPSAGLIRSDFDPVEIARTYERHGAHCISVLTDEKFFSGRLEYLTAIRSAVSAPVLRKDFLIDRYQVLEARVAGADCVLLIAECLDQRTLRDLFSYAAELGMQALVEIYDPENLERVLELGGGLLGINNRNLKTFETDLEHSIRLGIPVAGQTLLISESGIRSRDDVERLLHAGVRAILVGETLMRADDIGIKIAELIGGQASGDRS